MNLRLPRPDLFIAAVGRSGSTMLANLLTSPPSRWVIIEPRFVDVSTGRDTLRQATEFGWGLTEDDWIARPSEEPFERLNRIFAARLARLDKWGLKEVRPALLQPTTSSLRPRKVIVLVRNLLDVATSLVEKAERDGQSSYDEDWLRSYLEESPKAILDLVDSLEPDGHRVVRYESLVTSQAERDDISDWLDWPLDGDPGRLLADVYGRGREVDLHSGNVTSLALSRWKTTTSLRARSMAEWAVEANPDFQERFGYGSAP